MTNKNETLFPTGTCFDDTFEIVRMLMMPGFMNHTPKKDWPVIYHGLVRSPMNINSNEIFAHAWVGRFGKLYQIFRLGDDNTNIAEFTPEQFADLYEIIESTTYDLDEIIAMAKRNPSSTSGPWIQRYIEKCKDWKQND